MTSHAWVYLNLVRYAVDYTLSSQAPGISGSVVVLLIQIPAANTYVATASFGLASCAVLLHVGVACSSGPVEILHGLTHRA